MIGWNEVFLEMVLVKMRFSDHWVQLAMQCVRTVTFYVLINGRASSIFTPQRGLKQGDPLSPCLFILCGEIFFAMIQRALEVKSLSGLRLAHGAPVIFSLFFVNDNVIFFPSYR